MRTELQVIQIGAVQRAPAIWIRIDTERQLAVSFESRVDFCSIGVTTGNIPMLMDELNDIAIESDSSLANQPVL